MLHNATVLALWGNWSIAIFSKMESGAGLITYTK
jgi:hypothetical protein